MCTGYWCAHWPPVRDRRLFAHRDLHAPLAVLCTAGSAEPTNTFQEQLCGQQD